MIKSLKLSYFIIWLEKIFLFFITRIHKGFLTHRFAHKPHIYMSFQISLLIMLNWLLLHLIFMVSHELRQAFSATGVIVLVGSAVVHFHVNEWRLLFGWYYNRTCPPILVRLPITSWPNKTWIVKLSIKVGLILCRLVFDLKRFELGLKCRLEVLVHFGVDFEFELFFVKVEFLGAVGTIF